MEGEAGDSRPPGDWEVQVVPSNYSQCTEADTANVIITLFLVANTSSSILSLSLSPWDLVQGFLRLLTVNKKISKRFKKTSIQNERHCQVKNFRLTSGKMWDWKLFVIVNIFNLSRQTRCRRWEISQDVRAILFENTATEVTISINDSRVKVVLSRYKVSKACLLLGAQKEKGLVTIKVCNMQKYRFNDHL